MEWMNPPLPERVLSREAALGRHAAVSSRRYLLVTVSSVRRLLSGGIFKWFSGGILGHWRHDAGF